MQYTGHKIEPGRPNLESLIVVNLDETLLLNPAGFDSLRGKNTNKQPLKENSSNQTM